MWSQQDLRDFAPDLVKNRMLWSVGIKRTDTAKISGTIMRSLLIKGEKRKFYSFLPPINVEEKNEIWRILGGLV